MNYVVPGAYPGGGGGGGGNEGVNSVGAGDGILITGTATDVIVTNSGVVNLSGSGVATVTNDGVGNYTIDVTGASTTVNGSSGAVTVSTVAPIAIQTTGTQNIISIDFIPDVDTITNTVYQLLNPTTLYITAESNNTYSGSFLVSYTLTLSPGAWFPNAGCYLTWTGGTAIISYVRESLTVVGTDFPPSHSGTFAFNTNQFGPTKLDFQLTLNNITINSPGIYPAFTNATINVLKLSD